MYSTVLLDLDVFVKTNGKNLSRLLSRIQYSDSFKHKVFMLGVILVIPHEIKNKLESMYDNEKRLSFLNSELFVDSVDSYTYILYDSVRRICEILNYDIKFLTVIVNAIMTGFTGDTIIWIFAPVYDDVRKYAEFINSGFANPHIVHISPTGRKFVEKKLCMTRQNSIFEKSGNIYDFEYVLNNKNVSTCQLKIRFDDDTIKYLKQLPEVGFEFGKKGILTQRELSGKFVLTNKGDYFSVNIDDGYIQTGEETEVKNMTNRYNFHTLPD